MCLGFFVESSQEGITVPNGANFKLSLGTWGDKTVGKKLGIRNRLWEKKRVQSERQKKTYLYITDAKDWCEPWKAIISPGFHLLKIVKILVNLMTRGHCELRASLECKGQKEDNS